MYQCKGSTCQKRTSDQDKDTVVGGRLRIDGVSSVLYLLEWQVLSMNQPYTLSTGRVIVTWSFSTMAADP